VSHARLHTAVQFLPPLQLYYLTSQCCCTPIPQFLAHHAYSNADQLALCHCYPPCHKTVTAQCHIISSPLHLSLKVLSCAVLYSQQFYHFPLTFCITHSSFITIQQTNPSCVFVFPSNTTYIENIILYSGYVFRLTGSHHQTF
jgi:hypothetical protein